MKVIKEGKNIEGVMRVSCVTCKAVLDITAEDLKNGCNYRIYYYECPCCKVKNYVRGSDLSDEIYFHVIDHI